MNYCTLKWLVKINVWLNSLGLGANTDVDTFGEVAA